MNVEYKTRNKVLAILTLETSILSKQERCLTTTRLHGTCIALRNKVQVFLSGFCSFDFGGHAPPDDDGDPVSFLGPICCNFSGHSALLSLAEKSKNQEGEWVSQADKKEISITWEFDTKTWSAQPNL